MARRTNAEGLIHCNACGEDYSATYKRCPFCGERLNVRPVDSDDDLDDGFVFEGAEFFDEPKDAKSAPRSSGGRRLAARSSGRDHAPGRSRSAPPVKPNLPRLITFIFTLVIIIAALIIVFGVIYPKLYKNPKPSLTPSPSASQTVEPTVSPEPTVEPSGEPTGEPVSSPDSLTLSSYDFTLRAGESYTIRATLDPADWDGTVEWTSSDENYATVSADGTVANVNTDTRLHRVIITATAGGVSQECVVYCRGAGTSPDAPDVSVSPSGEPSGDPEPSSTVPAIGEGVEPGAKGEITGVGKRGEPGAGLNVREQPSTSATRIASLYDGDPITVIEDAGNGWFKISFLGKNATITGYIMGAYIKVTE